MGAHGHRRHHQCPRSQTRCPDTVLDCRTYRQVQFSDITSLLMLARACIFRTSSRYFHAPVDGVGVRHGRLSTFSHYSAAVPEHTARRWEWAIVCGARCLCFALLSLHKPSVPESPEFNLLRQFLKKGSDKGQVRFLSSIGKALGESDELAVGQGADQRV